MTSEPGVQLFLDCDGVLADFDLQAEAVLGMPPRAYQDRYGIELFWSKLQHHSGFYRELPLMADALELFESVAHLNPIILTGCPRGGWAEAQKLAWARQHFPGTKMITCMAREKSRYMKPGDVLVDDTLKFRHLWEDAGGIFILHRSAQETIAALRENGVLPAKGYEVGLAGA